MAHQRNASATTTPRDRRLLDAFAAAVDRVLSEGGATLPPVAVVTGKVPRVSRRAPVALVTGRRGRWWERVFEVTTGMAVGFRGIARAEPRSEGGTEVTVWDHWIPGRVPPAPPSFNVTAIVTVYNEDDVIGQLLDRLVAEGVRVKVINNWSTDETAALVQARATGTNVSLENFPPDGPSRYFEFQSLLERVEEVAQTCGADWVIHHDADEIHQAPWPDVGLRQALWSVEHWGFNAVDYVGLDFRPVDNSWRPGDDLVRSFEFFQLQSWASYFHLIKAWKPQPGPSGLAENKGHDVNFPGRRVFPYKFLARHYPIRSQAHGERKVFRERLPRFKPEERARGQHIQYDEFVDGSPFVWNPAMLYRFDELDDRLLLQRLTAAGLPGNPNPAEAV